MVPDEIQRTTRLADLHGVFIPDPALWKPLVEPAVSRLAKVIASESKVLTPGPLLRSLMEGALSTKGEFKSAVVFQWMWRLSAWDVFSVALMLSVDAEGTVVIGVDEGASRVAMQSGLLSESSRGDPTILAAESMAVPGDWHLGQISAQLAAYCRQGGIGPGFNPPQMQSS